METLPRGQPYVAEHGHVCDELQDGEPDADILSSFRHRPAILGDKLLSVQPRLHPVVNESEERSEGTRSHEDGDEPELNH